MDYKLSEITFDINKIIADSAMNLLSKPINVGPLFIMIMDAMLNREERNFSIINDTTVEEERKSIKISFNIDMDNIEESIKKFINKYRKTTDEILYSLKDKFDITMPSYYEDSADEFFNIIYDEIYNIYYKCVEIMKDFIDNKYYIENLNPYDTKLDEYSTVLEFWANTDYRKEYSELDHDLSDILGYDSYGEVSISFYWPEEFGGDKSLTSLAFTDFSFSKTKTVVDDDGHTRKFTIDY